MRILVVEDEPDLSEVVQELLEDQCYAVDVAADGTTADELMAVNTYDLVILDWTIPGPSGLELLRHWRGQGYETPVLMVTGRAAIEDKLDGLDTGADDYLTKPFSFAELLARVRSLLRRRDRGLQPVAVADLVMDRPGRQVLVGGEVIELTPKEFGVLEYLLNRVDEVVSRTELAEHAWDDSFDSFSNVIDVTIYRLRRKIDAGRPGQLLKTVKGVGYRLGSSRS
jgi:two-component system copper resistance phosphate regulon response regulator CusR